MKKILWINACVRSASRTRILAEAILNKLEGTVEQVCLAQANIAPLSEKTLQERDAYVAKKDFSAPLFQYARQFADADEIVLAAPYWDFSFPSAVKIYFEAVTVSGLTFQYTPAGCMQGLCKAQRLFYVTTAGGQIAEYHLGYDYVKVLAQVCYGIPQVLCYQAENLDIVDAPVAELMEKTLCQIAQDL